MEAKQFLNRPIIKAISIGGLTTVIGGICSALGSWDFDNDKYIFGKIAALVFFVILYLVLIACHSTWEFNDKKASRLYEQQNKAFEEVLSGIISLCKLSADGASDVIHEIIDKSNADLKIWSFDKACQWVCQTVYRLLCTIGSGKDFEVVYDRLDESNKPEIEVYANSYANKDNKRPSIYGKRRSINDDEYHDIELFRLKCSDIEIIIGHEEIDMVFQHKTREKRNVNRKKYNQYIAIPIFCNDKKMIGLFEIVCLNKTELGKNKEEIEETVSKYLIPYSFLVLILHKLERALIAQPN